VWLKIRLRGGGSQTSSQDQKTGEIDSVGSEVVFGMPFEAGAMCNYPHWPVLSSFTCMACLPHLFEKLRLSGHFKVDYETSD
jgi:hypothetical protein